MSTLLLFLLPAPVASHPSSDPRRAFLAGLWYHLKAYMTLFLPLLPLLPFTVSLFRCAHTRSGLTYSLTRMLMSRMLTRLGHQVTMAENGKIALQMIKDSQDGKAGVPIFDVCFLDK